MNNSNDRKRHRASSVYSDPSPYPEVRVLAPDRYYASLLVDDYAGRVSEFTAISQYLYHHFYFEKYSKDLGALLENVSIVEMYHMELLAEAIIKLGGDPQIRGSFSTGGNYWDGGYIYYGNQIYDQLKADIQAEYEAIRAYQAHISAIHDPCIQALLRRIILDEQVHIRHFNDALSKYCTP